MAKPRPQRKPQAGEIPEESRKNPGSGAAPPVNPHFRLCPDCGCFKPKHHGGVCQRRPQPLTKTAGDGCWDGVPLPVGGDEQITEVTSMAEVEAGLQKRLSEPPTSAERRAASLRITDTSLTRDSAE